MFENGHHDNEKKVISIVWHVDKQVGGSTKQ